MENLVGKRFNTLKEIEEEIGENLVELSFNNHQADLDFEIIGEFKENKTPFTLFYLVDNGGRMLITEIQQ